MSVGPPRKPLLFYAQVMSINNRTTAISHKEHQILADLYGRVEADRDLLQENIIYAEVEAPATAAALSSYSGNNFM